MKSGLKILLPITLITGCVPVLMLPVAKDVERANAFGNIITLINLQDAHKLYVNKCGNCHFLYRPYKFTKEKWIAIMPEMKKEAKLSDEEYNLMLKYLIVMQESLPTK